MKLHTFYNALSAMIDINPEILEYDVYYYSDDEGNNLSELHYLPTPGVKIEGEFASKDPKDSNAICIN